MQEQQHSEMRLRFLGCLAGMLSHELRNPLNAIVLHLDIIDEELRQLRPGDRTQVDLSLATIKTEVGRLHDLMQDYLVLVRLSDLQREPEDVRLVLEAVAREVGDQLAARGIILHLEGLDGLGEVSIHKSTLHRALVNIVQLTVEAMPQGGSLVLRGWRTPSHVHLAVQHTEASLQPKAVLQGYGAASATALEEENLALHVAQAIVTAHGGVLEASSTPGQGTTFTVILPYA